MNLFTAKQLLPVERRMNQRGGRLFYLPRRLYGPAIGKKQTLSN